MTRTVGHQDRTETEPDPAEALRRGRVLDAMLSAARLPVASEVRRATHRVFNAIDDERALKWRAG